MPLSPTRFLFAIALFSLLFGCSPASKTDDDQSNNKPKPTVKLKVLAIDSPKIAETAQRRWGAEAMGEVEFVEMTASEFEAANFEAPNDVDLIIFPNQYLAELVSRDQLIEVPKTFLDGDKFNRKEILPHQRQTLLRWGNLIWAMPLGDIQLTIVFDSETMSELEITPPSTWEELEVACASLQKAGKRVQLPVTTDWAGPLLLNRAAGMIRARGKLSTVFDIETMKPLLDTEPFVRSLESLQNMTSDFASPAEIYRNLVAGETALGITWPSSQFVDDEVESNDSLSVMRLPGNSDWFNQLESKWESRDENTSPFVDLIGLKGRMVGVNHDTRYANVAFEFATWITSKATSTQVSANSSNVSIFRATHLGRPSLWTGETLSPAASDQFGDVIREISEARIYFIFPRIPGQSEYLRELDQGVIDFLTSANAENSDAKTALINVVNKWEAITDRLGRDTQRKAVKN